MALSGKKESLKQTQTTRERKGSHQILLFSAQSVFLSPFPRGILSLLWLLLLRAFLPVWLQYVIGPLLPSSDILASVKKTQLPSVGG